MISSVIKLAALAAGVLGPLAGGWVAAHTKVLEASLFFSVASSLFGLGGILVFASIDRGERVRHDRALGQVREG